MSSIKIISDGRAFGTKVIDSKTGKELTGITAVSWSVDIENDIASAIINFIDVEVEIEGETT